MVRIACLVAAFAFAVAASAGAAQAQSGSGNFNGNNNSGLGSGNGNGNGNGNSSSATVNNSRSRNTPAAVAPGLAAAGTESCLGSATAGGSGPGFGFVFGTTTLDRGCNLRLFSRTLAALGHRRAATQILCNDPEVAAALSYEGVSCNAFGSARAGAVAVRSTARDAATPVGRTCRQYDLFRGCLD